MKYLNPLRTISLMIALSASTPVVVPLSMTIAFSCMTPIAVGQNPGQGGLPPLPSSTLSTGQTDPTANVKSMLNKAKMALADGNQEVATQAMAEAVLAAQAMSPQDSIGVMGELSQAKQQFSDRGITPATIEAAMKNVSSPRSGLKSRAANALSKTSTTNPQLLGANSTVPSNPGLLPPPSVATTQGTTTALPPAFVPPPLSTGPSNPLRDQAAGLTAQAKTALDRGDVATARKFIDQANSLRVPDSEFAPGQPLPWSVAMDVARAEKLRGSYPVSTASANELVRTANGSIGDTNDVRNASMQSSPFAPTNDAVTSGVYQPQRDTSQLQQASGMVPRTGLVNADESGQELYDHGIAALSAGNKQGALEYFSAAWKKQGELDPGIRAQLKDKLALLQSTNRSNGEPEGISALSAENRENQLKRQKLFAEVSGEIADAERTVERKPLESLDKLKFLRQRVSQSDVDGAYRKQMLATVDRVINNIQAWVDQNRSTIELDQRNKQVEDRIALERSTEAQTDIQVQGLVDQYNDLIDGKRFAEAESIAKRVGELKPGSEIARVLYQKAKIQRRVQEQDLIRALKEENAATAWNDVEAAATPAVSDFSFGDAKTWYEITKNRLGKNQEQSRMSPSEKRIRDILSQPFSASFDRRPLIEAMNTISEMTSIPIVINDLSIAEEGLKVDEPVTLDLRGNSIKLSSALNLMLERLNLTYVIKDEVIQIQSSRFTRRELITVPYSVKDLVIPIPNFVTDYNSGLAGALQSAYQAQTNLVSVDVEEQNAVGVAASHLASIDPKSPILAQMNAGYSPGIANGYGAGLAGMSNNGLMSGSSGGMGGAAIANYTNLMQLIEQTITPDQWQNAGGTSTMMPFRQNLTLIVNAPQETHEAIADLLKSLRALQNLQVTIEVRFITLQDTFFEQIGVDFQASLNDNARQLPRDDTGASVAVGLSGNTTTTGPQFTSDLDIKLSQGSFGAAPPFGNPTNTAGSSIGLAILSDLELFFFLQAAQGNSRQNVLQAPKVTMFDGQAATITDQSQRPFVIGFDPVVGDFAVAQRPIIVVLNEGTQMNVQSVVSQDKRFVRLTLSPQFTRLEATDREFTFTGSKSTKTGTSILNGNGLPTNNRNNEESVVTGTTVQQPTLGITAVNTTVSVPDGGTILLGGLKRLREGRVERGTPILSKIPYINRLFKNTGIGRETSTLMMTVTPRIIIPEEEEEQLGVILPGNQRN